MSVYGIVYARGFAVTASPEVVKWILEHNSEVELQIFNDSWEAYTWCCTEYSRRFLAQHPNVQHKLPTFDEVLKMPYHEPRFVENVPQNRFFTAMNARGIAIYDNVDNLIDFIMGYNIFSSIKEFDSEEKAMQYINWNLMMYVMPRSAYISGDFYTIRNCNTNMILSTQPLTSWYQENFHPPQQWPTSELYYQQNFMPFVQQQPALRQTGMLPSPPMEHPVTSML